MGIFKTLNMDNNPQEDQHLHKVANKVETKEDIEET